MITITINYSYILMNTATVLLIKAAFLLVIWFIYRYRDKIRRWRYDRRLEIGKEVLLRIDHSLTMGDMSRKKRNQFWRDFLKNRAIREQFIDKLNYNWEKEK